MCLLLEVLLPGHPPEEAGRLTRAAAEAGHLELRAQRQPPRGQGSRFLLGEPRQGCACSLMADDADWDAPYYALRPQMAEPLARTFEFLRTHAGAAGMYVRAAWVSDAPKPLAPGETTYASAELVVDIRAARIANNRAYRVSGAA